MIKRIRYTLNDDGTYVSKKIIETNHGEVLVAFNLDNRVVRIYSATDPTRLIDTFVSTTSHKLKIDIKNKLISMGAQFADETRNRDVEERAWGMDVDDV